MRRVLSHARPCIMTARLKLDTGYVIRADLTGHLSVLYSCVSVSVWACAQNPLLAAQSWWSTVGYVNIFRSINSLPLSNKMNEHIGRNESL